MTKREEASNPAAADARAQTLRAVKRQMVIDAAERVFEQMGLDGASIRLIAAEAGCTTGAVYPYFRGKEEIYGAILSQSLEALKALVAQSIEAEQAPVLRARKGLEAFYRYYEANPSKLSLGLYLFRGTGVRPTGLTPALNRELNGQLRAIVAMIEGEIGAAGFANAPALAADGLSHAVGLLIVHQAGRLRLLDHRPDRLMSDHLLRLLPGKERQA